MFDEKIIYINDDKPFIELANGFNVYGSPWNGKERLSNNLKGNLKGIFVISRAKENKVSKLNSVNALDKLIRQFYLPKGKIESSKALNALIQLCSNVPIYLLEVNMNDDAALVSGNIMKK